MKGNMKQNIKSIIITTGGIIGVAASVFLLTFIVLAWTGPSSTPPTCPEGEVGCDEVLHTGTAAQSKTGGLLLNTGGATNGLIIQSGKVGIGTADPAVELEVNGAIKIGETEAICNASLEGAIKYVNGFLKICDGVSWNFSIGPGSDKDITAFSIISPETEGIINGTNINIDLPTGTPLTSLVSDITISGDSISPESGTAQDFTSPITYTVTAEDESTKDYLVSTSYDLDWYFTSCGDFLVYKQDSGNTSWSSSMSTCSALCATCTLPDKTELACIRANRASLGNNYTTSKYWSSTEFFDASAWYVNFFDGTVTNGWKTDNHYIRCIRR
jgi:hypothetical protein